MELSSLSLASAINNKGIYLISAKSVKKVNKIKDDCNRRILALNVLTKLSMRVYFCFSIQLSLDTALKLQIPEEHDEGLQMRYYSLEDLRELQNKLMLMSGKGDQGQNEVDHFAEVFLNIFLLFG